MLVTKITKARKAKFYERLFKKAYAVEGDVVNTVTIASGQTTDDGQALKLDNNVRTVYSKEIAFKALPVMKFMQFAKVKTELGVQPGLTIQMMTYNNLKNGGKLKEGTNLKTQGMSSSLKSITVSEWGNAIGFSELAFRGSFTNLLQDATTLLSRDYATVVDLMLRDVALSGVNVVYARDKGEEKVTARENLKKGLTVCTIKDATELLATNNTPKIEGSYYVGFIHPHQSRELRDDLNWIDASKYAQAQALFTGEIGRLEDVRFIETTNMCNGAVTEGHNAYKAELVAGEKPVYQAVIFGDEYYGFAEALPVELRDNGIEDFGRKRALAWYGIWGAGLLNPERGVVIETL